MNVLILGDDNISKLDNKNYIYYLKIKHSVNDNYIDNYKTYKNIDNEIRNNRYIYNKEKKEYLNYNISTNSNVIIINANNDDYISKCNKKTSIMKQYNLNKYEELKQTISLINKISNSKIIIIGNYCYTYNKEISLYLNNIYKFYNYINMYELFNNYKNDNLEYHLFLEIDKMLK